MRLRNVLAVGGSLALALPLVAGSRPAAAAVPERIAAVALPISGGTDGRPTAVSGHWLVGNYVVSSAVERGFAADLSAASPVTVPLPTLGGPESYASGVSGDWIGGYAMDTSGQYLPTVWSVAGSTPSDPVQLGTFGYPHGYVQAIDGHWAVGQAYVNNGQTGSAAAWDLTDVGTSTPQAIELSTVSPGVYTSADLLDASTNLAVGLSGYGYEVWDLTGAVAGTPVAGYAIPFPAGYDDGEVDALGGTWAAGYSYINGVDDSSRATVWDLSDPTNPVPVILPVAEDQLWSSVQGVDGNWAVGSYNDPSDQAHAVAWNLALCSGAPASCPASAEVPLGTLGGTQSGASGVRDGWAVGQAETSYGAWHAFAYDLATGGPMIDLWPAGGDDGSSANVVSLSAADGDWFAGQSCLANIDCEAAAWSLQGPPPPASATTVSVDSSANPSIFDQSVTFEASVSSDAGTPTGTVQFYVDGTASGAAVTLNDGYATSAPVTFTSVGTHQITASYTSDNTAWWADSTTDSPLMQEVVYNAAATSVVLTSSANPSFLDQSVTFEATVSSDAGTPTGSVQFYLDGSASGAPVPLVGGTATSDSVNFSPVGDYEVTAAYTSDTPANWADSETGSALVQHVVYDSATTAVHVTSSGSPSIVNGPVTFTATVTSDEGTPTGSVQFLVDGTESGTPVSLTGGTATSAPVTFTSVGTHQVTASYTSDDPAQWADSTSTTALDQQVGYAIDPTVPSGAVVGDTVTVELRVTDDPGTTDFSARTLPVDATITWPDGSTHTDSFRYVKGNTHKGTQDHYELTLRTSARKGWTAGTYTIELTIGADPVTHEVTFSLGTP